MHDDNKKEKGNRLSRRHFIGLMGTGAAAGVATLAGCNGSQTEHVDPSGHYTTDVPIGQMTYRQFPKLGDDKVSLLGYGCMRWPTQTDANGQTVIDQETVNRLVDYAIEHGVNYFDTAPVYVQGLSEKATGIALSRHPRSSYYIATKMSNHRGAVTVDLNPEAFREQSIKMYHDSFANLQVDVIDFYLLHNVGGGDGIPLFEKRFISSGLLEFLMNEREAGRIRRLGWSFHGDVAVFDHLLQMHDNGECRWDFVQIQMNYLDWNHAKATNPMNVNAEYLYGELAKREIPCTIMEPLLGGRLSNVPNHVVARLKQREPENSVASWAFRFCGSHEWVLSALSGMTYMEHLQDNIRSFAPLKPLTQDELAYLENTAGVIASYPTIPCNQCDYCMPCPYALDIPAIFTHYNKCVNDGNIPESSQDPNYRRARQAFLVGYDRSVPRLRQASHCTGCNQCSPECPQRIDIPRQMQRIDQYVESLKRETL